MGFFDAIAEDTSVKVEADTDYVGGGYSPFQSDIYAFTIKAFFLGTSPVKKDGQGNVIGGGAHNVTVHLEAPGGKMLRETVYVTGGQHKGCKSTFVDKNGKVRNMPGIALMNGLTQAVLGKNLNQLGGGVEEKLVKIRDFKQNKDVATPVQMVMPLIGKQVLAAVLLKTVDKNVDAGGGKWVPGGETREINTLEKFFRPEDKLSGLEITAGATSPVIHDEWLKTWKDKTKNEATSVATGSGVAGSPAAAPAAAGEPAAVAGSIFG